MKNNKRTGPQKAKARKIKTLNKAQKNALVIYYSLEGYTKKVSEIIAKEINADTLELKTQKEIKVENVSKLSKYFWGGKQVMTKEKPALLPFDKNPDEYELIFIGTPVWAFTFTPAIRTFFSEIKLKNKKIVLFCTDEGSKGKTLENMEKELIGNKIIGKAEFRRPKKDFSENDDKIIYFAKEMNEKHSLN